MKTLLLTLSVCAAMGCTHAVAPKEVSAVAPLPKEGKAMAPVAIDAELSLASARVTLRFEAAAQGVSVVFSGLDGLALRGEASVLSGADVVAGETKIFDVPYTVGPGRSHLVVSVEGMFHGSRRNRVATFARGTNLPMVPGREPATRNGDSLGVKEMQ